jgi:hypothetical protein
MATAGLFFQQIYFICVSGSQDFPSQVIATFTRPQNIEAVHLPNSDATKKIE